MEERMESRQKIGTGTAEFKVEVSQVMLIN